MRPLMGPKSREQRTQCYPNSPSPALHAPHPSSCRRPRVKPTPRPCAPTALGRAHRAGGVFAEAALAVEAADLRLGAGL